MVIEIKKNDKDVFIRRCQFCEKEYLSENQSGNCCDYCLDRTKNIINWIN